MKSFQEYNIVWQGRIMRLAGVGVTMVIAFEIIYFVILDYVGLMKQSMPIYLLWFFVLPIFLMVGIYAACCHVLKNKSASPEAKALAALFAVTGVCTVASCVHHVFPSTLSSFALPITLSIVFASKAITNYTALVCILGQLLAMFFGYFDLRGQEPYFILDCLMQFFVFGIVWYVSFLLIKNEWEKRSMLDSMRKEKDVLARAVCVDKLTGLYNLLGLQLYAEEQQSKWSWGSLHSSIAFLDIDNFKQVNDTYGHSVGNEVLIVLAAHFKTAFPENACIARYGGDEFVVLLPGVTPAMSKGFLDKLLRDLEKKHIACLEDSRVSLSCGVAGYDFRTPVLDAISASDKAMYQAKALGKNQTVLG